ncbi:MAG: hypothetical protein IPO08_05225 [Xanthomonadales bacterium]|nr:hypothetical protein [Xanthomonadales bacterium]
MDVQRIDHKQRKWLRQIVIGSLASLAVLGLLYWVSTLDPAAPKVEQASLWIDTVKRGQMLLEVRGPGTLVPEKSVG